MEITTTTNPARKLDHWFNWTYEGKTHWGTLLPLDDFDRMEYAGLKLKDGQVLARYETETMGGRMKPLIVVNPDKGLVYHLKDGDGDVPVFETRGLKGDVYWLK